MARPRDHHRARAGLREQRRGVGRIDAQEEAALSTHRDCHVPSDQEREPAEHPLLGHA